ncbi:MULTISPECIES: hypothetical protein [unclassified Mesorhizobium]|uniref:hypothetical protein n=1 Tax=unclassified Mesorhizobium TaxID=325217 RepID=UPI00333C16F9
MRYTLDGHFGPLLDADDDRLARSSALQRTGLPGTPDHPHKLHLYLPHFFPTSDAPHPSIAFT